ncbi:maleylpyruvate isomerase family mycothiol-dependent enzyme [Mycolicibacterium hodleri]|uniref:Maleylpyruvate isomerase family mycothiol-dependent enzyme n=1 Tax=Mycolicibacterium hodleri TaxID=49897 RepID=A0A502EI38_9MYCO|nr:maleylpyruvate isomerase family mycothiol-dependent enzyme [Mycolicibacterium hodleri]TPG36672.1 maleylpyruvate isomerase family mycothiol-dependent enzyme [Mycolicibacterium hodleri]
MTSPRGQVTNQLGYDYLKSIEVNGKALLGIAADLDLALPVVTCPDWTLRDLLEHVSGANRWVTICVSSGLAAQERILPPGPSGREDLLEWTRESFAELLAVLSATAPDEQVWTPIRGALGSGWWRRKQAVEIAIHLADAETALGVRPETMDAALAVDGIDEFAEEFLPLMLLGVAQPPPVTAVLLSPTDIEQSRTLSLIPAGDDRDPGVPRVELTAIASELLLWMWNRVPIGSLTVSGDDDVLAWWKGLAI